ncbi:HtaA domain-containing protein [Streptomyces microflavus]|uniref:HtaA domain-containing protein n=1 Tax=Streptomyces microflavus TaxID=1919 RepID=UPI0033ADFD15
MAATRRPIALAAAVATAAALGATFALPAFAADGPAAKPAADAPAAAGAPSETYQLESGTLDWGVRASFRSMIDRMGGTATLADGATKNEDGTYKFPLDKGEYAMGTHAVTSSFKGSVHYEAHGGVLDIKLSDVKVLTVGKAGKITVDVTTKSPGKDAVVTDDLVMADLDLTDVAASNGAEGMKFAAIPATFTKEGAAVFGSAYKEGDPVDPATLTVKPVQPPVDPPVDPVEPPVKPPVKPPVEPTPTETAKPVSGPVVDGTLDWGLKKSFRSYVVGPIAHGKVETSDGATANADGYRFTKATGRLDAEKNTLNAQFKGKVRFLGHETNGAYELDLSLSNLKVDVQGTVGKLVADVSTKDRASGKVNTYTGLTFADLKVPAGALAAKEGVVNLKGIPATLTEDGSKAFSGMYKKGEELDALTTAVSLDKDATLPPGGSTDYENCAAAEAAGVTPIKKGEPGYAAHLDGDGDGIACESGESAGGSGSTGGSTTGGSTTGGGTVGGSTTGGSTTGGSVGGSGALAATGSDVPTGALIGASGLVVAVGAGIVVAARRRRNATA